jgi:ubiquinone/menaquinone biosynthesis C-methylase UbiE
MEVKHEADSIFESGNPRLKMTPARAIRREGPPASKAEYLRSWQGFFDEYAANVDDWHRRNAGYHRALASLAQFYIPSGSRVLEIGSGNGDLLAALNPSVGVGIDISGEMVRLASRKYPHLKFRRMAAEDLDLEGERFDFIILSDLVGYLYDIGEVYRRLAAVCHARTRVVVHWYSRVWQPLLAVAEKMGLKKPQPLLNWTTVEDNTNLFHLAGFEVIHNRRHILLPVQIPVVSTIANRWMAHMPGFRNLCLTNWMVAKVIDLQQFEKAPRVSVICPCRNESGNIEPLVRRLPAMGSHTELIFVEGGSKDGTLEECRRVAALIPEVDIKVYVQPGEGKGKGSAVREGFAHATGEILMILDADLSVAPEELPQFYDALVSGRGEFINGSRLVYVMDPRAMRFLNVLGNKFFALLLSWLLGQPIKDTLCGTKVLSKADYDRVLANRAYFGDFDPFGDFDLLFGAAKLNLKIIEVPIRYRQRVYGTTNISRFSDGWVLLRMCRMAARRIMFI